MRAYFAFGSNMRRSRLEARVGAVTDHGWAVLRGYRHRFNKHGADGTAKGNIVVSPSHEVHGVLYHLRDAQLETLARYEGGYRAIDLDIEHRALGAVVAVSFTAIAPGRGLSPTADYLEHYERGMIEHDLPAAYRHRILAEGRLEPGTD